MKKNIFILILGFISFVLYGQNINRTVLINRLKIILNESIDLLEKKTIPEGFERANRNMYVKHVELGYDQKTSIALTLNDNNIIIRVSIGWGFRSTTEATFRNGLFYDILEELGIYLYTENDVSAYLFKDSYAYIEPIELRRDGLIVSSVLFIKK